MRSTMRLIDVFVNTVLRNEGSFILVDKKAGYTDTYIQFMQHKVGNGRYVYGFYGWNSDFNVEFNNKPELVAIVADGIVYTVQDYMFNIWRDEDRKNLPENHRFFSDKKKELNDYVRNVIFKDFYDNLKIQPNENEKWLESCLKEARRIRLNKGTDVENTVIDDMFDGEETAKILCGLIDLKEVALRYFESERDYWVEEKTEHEKIKELVNASAGVEKWEIELSEVLRNTSAATVTVEFTVGNTSEQCKIEPQKIIKNLTDCDYFTTYDFPSRVQGKLIFDILGVNDSWTGDNQLKCEHISKITYKKKVLFERKTEISKADIA